MRKEALESADVVAAQLRDTAAVRDVARLLASAPPHIALTVARGSSDHAAGYFAHLLMTRIGIPVASLPLSIPTLHKAPLRVRGQVAVAFSQSGKSPDLVGAVSALHEAGAFTIAAVNVIPSPLAEAAQYVLPLLAGAETSVAATKSYIAMLSIAAQLVAHWQQAEAGDGALLAALEKLPDDLTQAAKLDWQKAVGVLKPADRMFVIGRGAGLAVAQEAALKLKETCGIQAAAYSSAEVRHGPMEIIEAGYPLLVFAPRGAEQAGLIQFAAEMRTRGASVLLASPEGGDLPLHRAAHPALDAIAIAQTFYLMAASLAEARGRNPDSPRHLRKVTETH